MSCIFSAKFLFFLNMTYKELAERISRLTREQQNMDVTVSCDASEECFRANYFHVTQKDDFLNGVLDTGHPIIAIAY